MRRLTLQETIAMESRQADLHSRIMLHNQIVQQGLWDQTKSGYVLTEGSRQAYPIPPWGLSVTDSQFGNVVVFPNAQGMLYFTGEVEPTIATEVNRGKFQSPTGNGFLQTYDDFLAAMKGGLSNATGTLKWATALVVGLLVLYVFMEVKKVLV